MISFLPRIGGTITAKVVLLECLYHIRIKENGLYTGVELMMQSVEAVVLGLRTASTLQTANGCI